MASTSIKVDADTKRALDELQARLTQETERKVTLQELTAALVRLGEEDEGRLVAQFVDRPRSLSGTQLDRLLRSTFDLPEVAPEEIDDLIYGFPQGTDRPATPRARRLHHRLQRERSPRRAGRRRKR